MSSSPDSRNPVIRGAVAEGCTAGTSTKSLGLSPSSDSAWGIERAWEQARTTWDAESWAQGQRESAVAAEEAAARARISEQAHDQRRAAALAQAVNAVGR